MYNIIGDVAGRYTELINLINIMPENNKIILVGDLIDRGPDSKKVVNCVMFDHSVIVLKGNHEDMMVQAFDNPYECDHLFNGGVATMKSYGVGNPTDYPIDHIEWMRDLPLFFETEGLFVSHAPWPRHNNLGKYTSEFDILWNRSDPIFNRDKYQIFGHNHKATTYYHDGIDYAQCIDNCGRKVLRGLAWPEKNVYEVPYV